jgi:hypothetical protein
MTNAQVAKIISDAASRGIEVSEDEVCTFLGAKELLLKEPNNKVARQVVEESTKHFRTGEKPTSFARFVLPIFETDEEIVAGKKMRDDFIEIYRRLGRFGIAEGDYTAAQKFQAQHNLTSAQILTMSESELKALAA